VVGRDGTKRTQASPGLTSLMLFVALQQVSDSLPGHMCYQLRVLESTRWRARAGLVCMLAVVAFYAHMHLRWVLIHPRLILCARRTGPGADASRRLFQPRR